MLLTDAQLHEIREIIKDHHLAFVASVISPDAVAPDILERLKEKGLVDVKIASIEDSYLYGQVLAALDSTKGMTYDQFKDHVRKRPVPLTDIEKSAIDMAQHSAGQYAVGLGNRIEQATGNIIYEADADLRAQMREEIRDLTAENIAKRESVKKLKSNLGWATRDWARDWDRIAVTEKQNAMQRGQADHIVKRYGEDAQVFKRVEPGACRNCDRLYLGPDGHPRIFKLSQLEANGTNYGKKTADWLPIVGATHPHCMCQISRMPAGWGFDEKGRLSPKGEGGIEYEGEDLTLALMQEDDLQKAFKLQGHTEFQGIPIAIENKPGSVRHWKSPDGEGGSTRMKYAYGFVKRTRGDDGDEIDCFLGPDPRAANAYVIHQQDPKTGRWDESKVFFGFANQKLAESAYREHYDSSDFLITTSPMSVDHFKRWAKGTEPSELFKAGEPVVRLVIPGERLEKAKYRRRWRGPDGKWRYEYDKPKSAAQRQAKPITANDFRDAFLVAQTPVEKIKASEAWHSRDRDHWREHHPGNATPKWVPLKESIADPKDEYHKEALEWIEAKHAHVANIMAGGFQKEYEARKRKEAKAAAYEAQGVELEGPTKLSKLRGESVWLYHGTSSKLLSKIKTEGLKPAIIHGKRSNVGADAMTGATPDHVYLTSQTLGPGSADWYANQAATKHGGDPVIIRVLVEGDDLERDPDDQDIVSGSTQFVVDAVVPEQIKEIGGKKLKKAEKTSTQFVIPAEWLKKAGPFIGPRGGKWKDPKHTIPWKEAKAQKPVKFRYGMRFRPAGMGAVPKGEFTVEKHPDFTHGVIVYNRALTPQEIKSFELEPILGAKALAGRVDAAVAKILSEYPEEQRELAKDSPREFAMAAKQAIVDQGLGHIPDIDALVEQVRKKVIEGEGPKAHEIKIHPKIAGEEGRTVTFRVVSEGAGKVKLSRHKDSDYGPVMPKESVKHFTNDLAGKVDLPPSGNPDIDAVTSGKAKLLGKGDDGLAFKVGNKVVKVSTTVPYQPENPGHRTPGQAAKMIEDQVKTGNMLADKGIKGIQRSKFVRHGDKGFQIKPWVEIPGKFTREQLDKIQDTVIAVHKAGWAIHDEIQPGLDAKGEPIMFDVGKAGPKSDVPDDNLYSDVTADMDNLKRLYQDHGQEFVRRDHSFGQQSVDRVMRDYDKWLGKNPKFTADQVKRAGDARAKELRITLSGKALDAALDDLDSSLWAPRVELEDKGIIVPTYGPAAAKEAEKPLSKAQVANIVGAATSRAIDRAPGQSSAANFAFEVPVKPRPPMVLPEDLMSIKDLNGRDERIKLDKETFEVREPYHKEPQILVIPLNEELDSDEIERNRKHLERIHRGNIGPKIQVPVEGKA